jgi:hypothetical protein
MSRSALGRASTAVTRKMPEGVLGAGRRYMPVLAIGVTVGLIAGGLAVVSDRNGENGTTIAAPGTQPTVPGQLAPGTTGPDGTLTTPGAPGGTGAGTSGAGRGTQAAIAQQAPSPKTANVCGRNGIIDTGTRVQFPWAVQCVEKFRGDNGGTTSKGVFRDKIRVAYYVTQDPLIIGATKAAGGCGERACAVDYAETYTKWFRKYFETYGRDVEIVFVNASGRENDVTAAKNDARRIAALDPPVFASVNGPGEAGTSFAEELAAHKILCLNACGITVPQEFYNKNAPYVWGTLMSAEQAHLHRAEYIGKRLAGRKARWAGDSLTRNRVREFGIVWFDNDRGDYAPGNKFLREELERYGVKVKANIRYTNIEGCQINATNIVSQLQTKNVTTVIMTTDPLCPIWLTKAARGQRATWEYFVTGAIFTDTNNFGRLYDQEQWQRAFGVSFLQPDVKNEFEYWYKMYKEINPEGDPKEEAPVVLSHFQQLFTGAHLAGPRLTPFTFRQGMARAIATGGTVTLPRRTYGPKTIRGFSFFDYNAYDDMTELWWDPNTTDPNGRSGAYWYLRGGKRYLWGQWPTTEPRAFTKQGATTGYPGRPPDQ